MKKQATIQSLTESFNKLSKGKDPMYKYFLLTETLLLIFELQDAKLN